jgi:hypothetical protein
MLDANFLVKLAVSIQTWPIIIFANSTAPRLTSLPACFLTSIMLNKWPISEMIKGRRKSNFLLSSCTILKYPRLVAPLVSQALGFRLICNILLGS